MRWKSFSSKKPTKSLKELKSEVEKLKEAESKVKSYQELLKEKERIKKEIKKEGFKMRHRNALAIIHSAENIGKRIGLATEKGLIYTGKKSRPYVHRWLKKRHPKLARFI